ncbi:MAG TPA: hypothetical protein VFT00_02605 [Nocardioides sp.]|nr:hypothetical protein [Nocardioides sp.]
MEPIPETVRAIEELGPFAADGDLLDELRLLGGRVSALVPDCVGLSLLSAEHGVTFTLSASDTQVDVLDAIQCLADASGSTTTRIGGESGPDDPLDEEAWRRSAAATAARGVVSSLTMPLLTEGVVTGAVSLYGASSQAFTGLHEQLAAVFGAWAPGAVANADLSFTTRREAEQAPRRLRDESTTDRVAHLVAHAHHVSLETAHQRIREAAARAGITEEQFAEAMVRLRRRPR